MTLLAFIGSPALAAITLPGSADVDRIVPIQKRQVPDSFTPEIEKPPELGPQSQPPEGASKIKLTLKSVHVDGVTAYTKDEIEQLYHDKLGKEITLDQVWVIAAELTKRYRDDGYFLSRAYVPAQEIGNGDIKIGVVEGYVGQIEFDNPNIAESSLVQNILATIKSERPVRIASLERQHLLLTDLPGMSRYQGTLTPLDGADEGAVKLVLSERAGAPKQFYTNFDNYGSRYLGPHELSGGWQGELLSSQETSISVTVSAPARPLVAVNGSHKIPLTPELSLEMAAGITRSEPGFHLNQQEIVSRAVNASVGFNYQLIRQRRENLALKLAFDARNSQSTILHTDLSKDKIRALRATATFDRTDSWMGISSGSAILSHGIDGLGASDPGYVNLSRSGAKPDFSKLELELRRLQYLSQDWSGQLAFSGQKASGSLYSSEEFGYGGQQFGRAYDQSEITGDEGVSASAELRYTSLPSWQGIAFVPYGFYDIGKVWNRNTSQASVIDASSAGAGVRLSHENGLTGLIGLAFPLSKQAETPIYGNNKDNPRLGIQFGYSF